MRVRYADVFQTNADGSIGPRVPVHINGVTMGPGIAFGGGVLFGGVDLASLRGRDLEVLVQGGVYVIQGHY